MESKWIVDRSRLRLLHQQHPNWKKSRLAKELGYSLSWVKEWLKRFATADPDDDTVLFSRSRAPCQRQKLVQEEVERKILEIRDHPPGNLARVPGPVTILYYLHHDEEMKQTGAYLPRSTSTIWSILDRNQRIYRYRRRRPEPEERPEPLSQVQIDFKSVSSVPADPDGKQQHVVETLNIVDKGTSILLTATPRDDYNAETVITTMIDAFSANGLPEVISFDRDPRFIGSWTAKEFPSAFMRLLMCLGIRINVCPPQRPDKNAFVERYHRNYEQECLAIHRPNTLAKTICCTTNYLNHYNWERPNQAITCGNLPPRLAFPNLPKRPGLPTTVDPDSWLNQIHGRYYRRRVKGNGTVQIGRQRYYISRKLHRQSVVLRVDAPQQRLAVLQDDKLFKHVPLKGLYNSPMLLEDYIPLIQAEAVSDYRRYLLKRRYRH
jgi:transposase InsO family protein